MRCGVEDERPPTSPLLRWAFFLPLGVLIFAVIWPLFIWTEHSRGSGWSVFRLAITFPFVLLFMVVAWPWFVWKECQQWSWRRRLRREWEQTHRVE